MPTKKKAPPPVDYKRISDVYVPAIGPTDAKIMFVGEAPGEDEEREKEPFIGHSGSVLTNTMRRNGMAREDCFITNVSHYRPYQNNFDYLRGSSNLEAGLKELKEHVLRNRPTVICALGNEALTALTGKKGSTVWRGSILPCIYDSNIKVIPTVHPALVAREMGWYPIFDFDLRRVRGDSEFREFRIRNRELVINPEGAQLEVITRQLCAAEMLACDIESSITTKRILCIAFAPTPDYSVCIPWNDFTLNYIVRILASGAKKIFQFGTFDTEMLWLHGVEVNNYTDDTMVLMHTLEPELPRSLAFLTSIYTREPYYKSSGRAEIPRDDKAWNEKTTSKDDLYIYNAKDSAVTIECFEEMSRLLDARSRAVYDYRISLLPVAAAIGRAGLPIDMERYNEIKTGLKLRWALMQNALNAVTGRDLNVRSPKALNKYLYEDQELPAKRNRQGGLTSNEDAIIELIGYCKNQHSKLTMPAAKGPWKHKIKVLETIIKIRGIRQILSNYLNVPYSKDGRVRCTYKVSATETARWACDGYVDDTGFNAQTLPRDEYDIGIDDMLANLTEEQKTKMMAWLDEHYGDLTGAEDEAED